MIRQRQACPYEVLAVNGLAEVQRCRCGCLSVHMGPVTLRLDAVGLEALWSVVGEALMVIHAEEGARGETRRNVGDA